MDTQLPTTQFISQTQTSSAEINFLRTDLDFSLQKLPNILENIKTLNHHQLTLGNQGMVIRKCPHGDNRRDLMVYGEWETAEAPGWERVTEERNKGRGHQNKPLLLHQSGQRCF